MSLELVKKLRDMSGMGIVDCQKALKEANDDFDKAVELIRKRGQQIVNKTADRVAKEGVIVFASSSDNKVGAIMEMACETDFVARNEDFVKYANAAVKAAVVNDVADIESLMNSSVDGRTVKELQDEVISKIKEKIEVKRFTRMSSSSGVVSAYVHFDGKSGAMMSISNTSTSEKVIAAIKDLGMHAVALKPQYLNVTDIPADVVAKEKEILMAQPDMKSKPAEIAEKIVAGRVNKFYSENCFVEQLFVKDDSMTVKQVAASLGDGSEIKEFVLYELTATPEAC